MPINSLSILLCLWAKLTKRIGKKFPPIFIAFVPLNPSGKILNQSRSTKIYLLIQPRFTKPFSLSNYGPCKSLDKAFLLCVVKIGPFAFSTSAPVEKEKAVAHTNRSIYTTT